MKGNAELVEFNQTSNMKEHALKRELVAVRRMAGWSGKSLEKPSLLSKV